MSKKLVDDILMAKKKVEIGAHYYHFKNPSKLYVIEQIGILENTKEVCVVYKALYGEKIVWIRTLENFLSKKETEKGEVVRFTKVG